MKKILFITGELSGETHTRNLVKYIKQIRKNIKCYAIGSDLLRKQGCIILEDYKNISIIGLAEVIGKYFYILKVFKKIKKFLETEKPDVVVLVDFPGFNLNLAKYCKKLGIKTIYFIAPQIWAWHYKRIKKIKKYIEFVIPVLPFEEKIYKKEKIPVKYFGHPIVENINVSISKRIYKSKLKIPKAYKVISLFPGSRKQEIEYNLDIILETAALIQKKIAKTYFLIGCAPTINTNIIKEKLKKYCIGNIKIIQGQTYNLLNISDCAIVVSGTITLEATYFKTPMVVIYNLNKISLWLIKNFLIKVKFISLVNLIAGKRVVQEFVGKTFTSENVAEESIKLLNNKKYREKQIAELEKIKKLLGKKGSLKETAKLILSFL